MAIMSDSEHNILRVIESGDDFDSHRQMTYCVGCGACAYLNPAFSISMNENGCYQAKYDNSSAIGETDYVCPFASSVSEDAIAAELFADQFEVQHDEYIGYYLNTYVGYVKVDSFREGSSSGGFATWLAAVCLQEHLVDYVIHVKQDANCFYSYQVSSTVDEVRSGAKSKYFPIEMSHVLRFVRENEGKYLFIGLPCFVKAIRLLARKDSIIRSRVKYCIGLVCGHLKSSFFAQAEAWECGIKPQDLKTIDFRYKLNGARASDYGVKVVDRDGNTIVKRTAYLTVSDWGKGYFKYNSCEFCDDVVSETADVTFGDAWLPQFVNDSKGMNIIIVRNAEIQSLINRRIKDLHLTHVSADEIRRSQSGGFRHRRQGLAFRLKKAQENGRWVPTKRVSASDDLPELRKKIYLMRETLREESFVAFNEALKHNDYRYFRLHMIPLERKYFAIGKPLWKRVLRIIIPNVLRAHLRDFKQHFSTFQN